MNTDANHQPSPAPADVPERIPLVRLARPAAASPALLRVVDRASDGRGPGRVAVAAFNSSV